MVDSGVWVYTAGRTATSNLENSAAPNRLGTGKERPEIHKTYGGEMLSWRCQDMCWCYRASKAGHDGAPRRPDSRNLVIISSFGMDNVSRG